MVDRKNTKEFAIFLFWTNFFSGAPSARIFFIKTRILHLKSANFFRASARDFFHKNTIFAPKKCFFFSGAPSARNFFIKIRFVHLTSVFF